MAEEYIGITSPIRVTRVTGHSSIDSDYGPYSSINNALEYITYEYDDFEEKYISRRGIGLTIAIYTYNGVVYNTDEEIPVGIEPDGVVEYWWKSGITDDDLVVKSELPTVSDDAKGKYLKVNNDGNLSWEENQGGSGKTSEVMALKPTYSDDGTVTYEGMKSTKLEHLTSQYREKSGGEPKTADVIAVQNTDESAKTTSFHLMINPQILMVMDGGGAESKERVLIMCDNYFETASVEGDFGVHYLYVNNMFATNPSDATTTWYSDSACTIPLGTGDTQDDGTYIPAGTTGTLTLYAIARKGGYIDSYKHKIEFVRTSEKISVRVTVQDVTRTNGQTEIAVQHEEEAR